MPYNWSAESAVMVIYFISRGLGYKAAVEVIRKKCGTAPTHSQCAARVVAIRNDMQNKHDLPDPLNKSNMTYDIRVVDEWLARQTVEGKLEDWLGINDDEVKEIVRKHV